MLRALLPVITLLLVFVSFIHADTPYPNIAPTEPKTPAEELATFKVPPGFEVQLVASEPDIRKPIQMCFDAKGRLWVTTSEEYPFAAIGRPGKDRLYVLEDFGPDGKAKKVSIFADDLNIPIGVVPLPDCKSVIVSSIEPAKADKETPTCWIWKLTDTDGDGKYDKKEKLYGPFGCIDTHGLNNSYTLMPDGWIYACHGFKNDSRPKGKDGHEIVMNSGNTFRFRPDGSRIEIWTRGQVNPFGIAVDPYFNLYTADCHSKPITQLIRGATYQSFGKQHDGLGFAPHVTIHGHDSTALCGLVYYAADHFPKEYLDHMFLGNVTSNCINWDKIEFKGSTPIAIDKGMFLSSKDLWFRPTDIKLGPDGALYFADFYNKIIGHYEVDLKHPARDKLRGRVWRIVWKGTGGKGEGPKMMEDLTKATLGDLARELDHPSFTVNRLALEQIQSREMTSHSATDLLKSYPRSERGRAMFVWVFMSHQTPDVANHNLTSIATWREATPYKRAHLVRALGSADRTSQGFESRIVEALRDEDVFVRRAAVEALGQMKFPGNVRGILDCYHKTPEADALLRYAARVALQEQLKMEETWTVIPSKNWTPADAATIAEVCLAIHSDRAARYLVSYLRSNPRDTKRFPEYFQHISRYCADIQVKAQIAELFQTLSSNPADQLAFLLAIKRGHDQRGATVPKEILEKALSICTTGLEGKDPSAIQSGIELATSLRSVELFDPLVKLIESKDRNEAQRVAALPALVASNPAKASPIIARLLNDASAPIVVREKSSQLLAGLNRPEARDELVKALAAAPARLQTVIAAALAASRPGAEALLKAIETGKASARLLQDKGVQTKLNDSKLPKTAERIAMLTKGLPSADQKMLDLMKQRSVGFAKAKPDAALGKLVFTKNCANCHQIGNEGVKVGPQLDGIGGRGMDRLLEDILDPNRNVDAAFRVTYLTMKDGKTVPGLVLREEGQILVLADDKGKEVRIPKGDIEEKRLSLLSPMPANLVDTIPEKDFHDLIAYLLTQRAKEK